MGTSARVARGGEEFNSKCRRRWRGSISYDFIGQRTLGLWEFAENKEGFEGSVAADHLMARSALLALRGAGDHPGVEVAHDAPLFPTTDKRERKFRLNCWSRLRAWSSTRKGY